MDNKDAADTKQGVNLRGSIELTKIDPEARVSNLSDQPAKSAYSRPEEIDAPEKIGGFMGLLKWGLVVFNTLIWLLGLAITAVSVWLIVDPTLGNFVENVDMRHLRTAAYIGVVVGVFIITIGIIGCCGALMESLCLLGVFLLIGILFIIMEAAAIGVVWSAVNNKDAEDNIGLLIRKGLGNRKTNNDARYFIDLLQERLKCCGITGPAEYRDEEDRLPRSCLDPDTGMVFETGCVRNMLQYLKSKASIFGGVAIATLLLQLGAIVIAVCLICTIRQAAKPIF